MAAGHSPQGTITLTIGDRAENHTGMQMIGRAIPKGYSPKDLRRLSKHLAKSGIKSKIVDLRQASGLEDIDQLEEATVLVIRRGVDKILGKGSADKMWEEIHPQKHDKKMWNQKFGAITNKKARWNLCISDHSQKPDYLNKKGRVIAWKKLPISKSLRDAVAGMPGGIPDLVGETNYYYDLKKCGIGFHGDTERRVVIGVRLGESMNMVWQWYHQSRPVGSLMVIEELRHGDMYIMSEKALGFDWKKRSIYTLRHAAGADKYITN